jgi:hypothetical protein
MSTNLACEFFEFEPNQWYCALQSDFCPVMAWDWREEDPTVAGPFDTFNIAYEHLRKNHANPGGYSRYDHAGFRKETIHAVMVESAAQARRRESEQQNTGLGVRRRPW